MTPIRVLIADDQALVRGALATLLGLESDLEVVAQVGRGDEVLDAVREHAVDVALVDIDMPGRDGLAATAEVVGSGLPCRCLIVTTFGRPGYLQRALDAGATGFMVKDAPVEALADGVRTVASGGRAIDQSLALEALSTGSSPLTDREADVLREVEGGGTIADIAHSLHLSQGTVRNHVSSSMLKMDARTRAEAASLARAAGWL